MPDEHLTTAARHGQQQAPAALGSKLRLAQGHMKPCAAQSSGAQESHLGGHTSEHWQPLCATAEPGVQTARIKTTCLGTLQTQAKEAGAGTVLALIVPVAEFDAVPMFGVAQLAPGTYTPALAGLCPWPGGLPWHRARSRHQLPAANPVLCPVPAVLPCRTPAIPAPQGCRHGLSFGSTHPQPKHDSLHSVQTIKPFPAWAGCRGSSAGSQLRLQVPCEK